MLFARRRAIVVHQRDGRLNEFFRQFAGIGNGRAAADELRAGPVKGADAAQTPYQVRQVAAENAPVMVDFIDDHILEIFEKTDPDRVMGQNPSVQHVRIGHDNMPGIAHRRAGRGGRVSVKGIRANLYFERFYGFRQFRHLVLAQRLGGEQVKGAALGIPQQPVEHRQVVTKRFA